MIINWFIFFIIFGLCLIFIRYHSVFIFSGIKQYWILLIFILKVCVGISYTSILPGAGDTLFLFRDGLALGEYLKDSILTFIRTLLSVDEINAFTQNNHFWNKQYEEIFPNDNRTIIIFHAVCSVVSNGFYYTHVVIANLLALVGLTAIYKTLEKTISVNKTLLFILIFLSPSILFWGSAMLKEPLHLFLFGLTILFYQNYAQEANKKNFTLSAMLTLLCFSIKPYVLLIALPGLLALRWAGKKNRGIALPFVYYYLIAFMAVMSIAHFNPEYDVAKLLMAKQANYITQSQEMNQSTDITLPVLDGSVKSVLLGAPLAFANGFTQPSGEGFASGLRLIPSVELLLMLIIALILLSKLDFRSRKDRMFYFSLFLVTILLTFLGFLIPYGGTLIRLKMIALPFIFYIIISLSKRKITA